MQSFKGYGIMAAAKSHIVRLLPENAQIWTLQSYNAILTSLELSPFQYAKNGEEKRIWLQNRSIEPWLAG